MSTPWNATAAIRRKQLAFLEDMAGYYNLGNRGLDKNGECSYVGGCAIGRKLPREVAKKLDSMGEGGSSCGVGYDSAMELLRAEAPELAELGAKFLTRAQILHDGQRHWGPKGINEEGLEEVESIKRAFNLG